MTVSTYAGFFLGNYAVQHSMPNLHCRSWPPVTVKFAVSILYVPQMCALFYS